MDRDLLMKAMKASISEVLEKMFFLPLELSQAGTSNELWENPAAMDLMAVSLAFEGGFSGHFMLLIPRTLGRKLTADFMGVEEGGVPPEHVEETAKEILNMIAGNTFGKLDERTAFQLGIPETVSAQTVIASSTAPEKETFVGIETHEGRMCLKVVTA